ncbi:hypothetical protein V8G54_029646 [Vigna mungo]|uniref:Uncharacterized protein n=1 Tax=Vigna mungo TaxID=3915 RepID=A0AAQ3RMU4_VIGMU
MSARFPLFGHNVQPGDKPANLRTQRPTGRQARQFTDTTSNRATSPPIYGHNVQPGDKPANLRTQRPTGRQARQFTDTTSNRATSPPLYGHNVPPGDKPGTLRTQRPTGRQARHSQDTQSDRHNNAAKIHRAPTKLSPSVRQEANPSLSLGLGGDDVRWCIPKVKRPALQGPITVPIVIGLEAQHQNKRFSVLHSPNTFYSQFLSTFFAIELSQPSLHTPNSSVGAPFQLEQRRTVAADTGRTVLKEKKQTEEQKVKVRRDDDGELGLKAFLSLYLQPSSPVAEKKVVSMPSVVRVPECYVPHVTIPRVPLTEDSDFSVSSVTTGSEKDGSTDENIVNIRVSPIPPPRAVISSPGKISYFSSDFIENEIIRTIVIYNMHSNISGLATKTEETEFVSVIVTFRPSRNTEQFYVNRKLFLQCDLCKRDGRLSTSKNGAVLQNRHAHCKVRSHDVTGIPSDTRKHREPGSKEEIDSIGKKKTHKGSIKFEKVPWRF